MITLLSYYSMDACYYRMTQLFKEIVFRAMQFI